MSEDNTMTSIECPEAKAVRTPVNLPEPLNLSNFSLAKSVSSDIFSSLVRTKSYIPNNLLGVCRTKSSFSFKGLEPSPIFIPNVSEENTPASTKSSGVASSNANSPKRKSPLTEDKHLKDLEAAGFQGLWVHPMTKAYLLMFFISKDCGNSFFFRQDVMLFRNDCRRTVANRIYQTYLSKHALLPVYFQTDVKQNLNLIKNQLDDPTVSLFDELAFLAQKFLEDAYGGVTNNTTDQDDELKKLHFKESVFYQMMLNDLRGKWKPSYDQYQRTLERMLDIPCSLFKNNEDLMNKFEDYLCVFHGDNPDTIKLNHRKDGGNGAKRESLMKPHVNSRTRSISSMSSSVDMRKVAVYNESEGDISPTKETLKKSNTQQYILAESLQAVEHAFVRIHGSQIRWCEYCYETTRDTEALSLYQCQACAFTSHKSCRNQIHVSCSKAVTTSVQQQQQENLFDKDAVSKDTPLKIEELEKRIQSIQKEVDIETRILDGLMKMEQAKNINTKDSKKSKKSSPVETDITGIQIEKSNKKLDVLKSELSKCNTQLESLKKEQQALEEKKAQEIKHRQKLTMYAVCDNSLQSVQISSEVNVVNDLVENMSVGFNTESSQASICNLFGVAEDSGEENFMDKNLQISNIPSDIKERKITAVLRNSDGQEEASPMSLTYPNGDNMSSFLTTDVEELEKEKRKQQEVLIEIIDSENQYLADLSIIVEQFMTHLSMTGSLSIDQIEHVFSNIESIHLVHSSLVQKLNEKDSKDPNQLIPIIKCFQNQVCNLVCYNTYCGNQHNSRRTLNEWKNNPELNKEIHKIETNPKLNKLLLADLLVKPMHRITRYPLLFKRLLSHTVKSSAEYIAIETLVFDIQSRVAEINEIVRQKESSYRISIIDENFDFNSIVERFKVANGSRELLSEKTFSYVRKPGLLSLELVVFVFNDMIMLTKLKKPDHFILMKPPIPFESCVLLEKSDLAEMKNLFQIIHLQNEIHTLQSRSKLDKNQWLQETENARLQFCASFFDYESALMKNKFQRLESGIFDMLSQSLSRRRTNSNSRNNSVNRKPSTNKGSDEQSEGGLIPSGSSSTVMRKTSISQSGSSGCGTSPIRDVTSLIPKKSILKKFYEDNKLTKAKTGFHSMTGLDGSGGNGSNWSISQSNTNVADAGSVYASHDTGLDNPLIREKSKIGHRVDSRGKRLSRSFDMLTDFANLDDGNVAGSNQNLQQQQHEGNIKVHQRAATSEKKDRMKRNFMGGINTISVTGWLKKKGPNKSNGEIGDPNYPSSPISTSSSRRIHCDNDIPSSPLVSSTTKDIDNYLSLEELNKSQSQNNSSNVSNTAL